jgi:hypothetical protein
MTHMNDFLNWTNATFGGLTTSASTAVCFDLKNSECAKTDNQNFNTFLRELHDWFMVQYAELIPTEHHGVYKAFDNLSHNDREWIKDVAHRIKANYSCSRLSTAILI